MLEPTWLADFVLTLARETGWEESFILLDLPLSRALQYRHVILRRRGFWTLAPTAAPESQLSRLKAGLGKALGVAANRLFGKRP